MLFEDVETCGRHGFIVLIQTAIDDGEIELYEPWREPVSKTLKLIEFITNYPDGICGFNLAFDWFHFCKMYTCFKLLFEKYGDVLPEDYIEEVAMLEMEARDGPCLKPVKCLDLMLHARKGPFQSMMNRDDIRIRRVPTALAWQLAEELEKRIPLPDIYFARRADKSAEKWRVYDIEDEGEIVKDFKDIVCKFASSTALKALAVHAGIAKENQVLKYMDIECTIYPEECGWAPFAFAVGSSEDWKMAWPQCIPFHIQHWAYNNLARKYATDDIHYTRGLYKYFGCPAANDTDSILACMVASVRWRGFTIDIPKIRELREQALKKQDMYPRDARVVRIYLEEVMDDTEKLHIRESTGKAILEEMVQTWSTHVECLGAGCNVCKKDGKIRREYLHPAAIRAEQVLSARQAKKAVEMYDKLLQAGRFHASFIVIGTKSSRMAGTDGLNAQGINHSIEVRIAFTLKHEGEMLSGGDFESFEISLAEAEYNDPNLRADLLSGKKFAAILGEFLYPDKDYDEIMASKGTDDDYYDRSKRGSFAFLYGGNENTWENRIGIPADHGKEALIKLQKRYRGVGEARQKVFDMFCSMRQPGGIGSKVEWHEPADYIESMFGFRRYFTLENKICKALFNLAENPPEEWKAIKIKVVRRDRVQTATGALQSALFGAAFQIQAANLRAAANHRIQSSGATVTKEVEVVMWSFQPCGIHAWVIQPFNIHDELEASHDPKIAQALEDAVQAKVAEFRKKVPLIAIGWKQNGSDWSDMK